MSEEELKENLIRLRLESSRVMEANSEVEAAYAAVNEAGWRRMQRTSVSNKGLTHCCDQHHYNLCHFAEPRISPKDQDCKAPFIQVDTTAANGDFLKR